MESLPLITKSNVFPNLDVTSLIREIFQNEFESQVPSKKLSENLRKSLEYEKLRHDLEEPRSFRSVSYLENLPDENCKLMDYAENVYRAYGSHEEALDRITKVELDIMETQAVYLKGEQSVKKDEFFRQLLKLKRKPLLKSYNPFFVKEYKLLQGESGLPPKHETCIDFRVKDFGKWKKKLNTGSEDSLVTNILRRASRPKEQKTTVPRLTKPCFRNRKKRETVKEDGNRKSFEAFPQVVYFTNYEPGDVYECFVEIRNISSRPMKFFLRPLPPDCPFRVKLYGSEFSRLHPGLTAHLLITFEADDPEDHSERIVVLIEDGSRLIIPLSAYLEAPLLKTHEDLNEYTKDVPERIESSYVECGPCFPGDFKVTKLRFYSFGDAAEFFVMSRDNWDDWNINSLTADNFTYLPPFRLYPTYFKINKKQVIDLYVEFKPFAPGLHSDNVVIACSNGEIRDLDLLGDGIAWNRSFFQFEDFLKKTFPPELNDDRSAFYYLDLGSSYDSGKLAKTFCVANVSCMSFEFRWEMRDPNLTFESGEISKLLRTEVRVEPSSGIFEPGSDRTFAVSASFNEKTIGLYRTVLSLYVIGLPYRSIEQASTVIRPSAVPGRYKSESFYGEEENFLASPEFSFRGTYESVQESLKTSSENKQPNAPQNLCRSHPGICAIPLKKSRTFSNMGDYADGCTCIGTGPKEQPETTKNQCSNVDTNSKKEKVGLQELGSNLLWDFVDVLVDEIEVWAEIVPTEIDLEPKLIDVSDDLGPNRSSAEYFVTVRNRNHFPIHCKWSKCRGRRKSTIRTEETGEEVNTLFQMGSPSKSLIICEDADSDFRSGESSLAATDVIEEYQITEYISQRWKPRGDCFEESVVNKFCDIEIEPESTFLVGPYQSKCCRLVVSSADSGIINRVIHLCVNEGHLRDQLYVVGKISERDFGVGPHVLDFGLRKQGSRYDKPLKIQNLSSLKLEWNLKEFEVHLNEKKIFLSSKESGSNAERSGGSIQGNEQDFIEYRLDARVPGMHCFLLKFEIPRPAFASTRNKYVLVLGNVEMPDLLIKAPRFNNAILAPSTTMYVGRKITQSVIVKNTRMLPTIFMWGYPFGCHCRKLEVTVDPIYHQIRELEKIEVKVHITPVEEGIVEHCYLPCFFSRNTPPLVLSIVGVVRQLQVVFEIGDRTPVCDAPESNGSHLKIEWPIKNFDPTIGITNLREKEILEFACHCDQVEAEYLRSLERESEKEQSEEKRFGEDGAVYFGEEYEPKAEENPCTRKFYTPSRMLELRKVVAKKKLRDAREVSQEESEEGEPWKSITIPEYQYSQMESESTLAEYSKSRQCVDLLYYVASELQFLDVRYRTVAAKRFVIRNKSPLKTFYALRVKYFSRIDLSLGKNRLRDIRNRVNRRPKGEFEDDLIHGQPLLISVSPSEGYLDGWDSVSITVSVYGDTWGEYRDFIVCEVSGTPPFLMKVFVRLSGHPIMFPMFGTSLTDIPSLRFLTVKQNSSPLERVIRVRNTTSIPITVTWMVFLTAPVPDDENQDPFNLCLDLYTDKESEDPEKATKSSQNYLSKNTSASVPLLDMEMDKMSSPGNAEPTSLDSSKKDSPFGLFCDAENEMMTAHDTTKPEIQLLENFGKMDLHIFQICPRELDLEPHSDEKITINFDPNYYELVEPNLEYEAVVTGCIRLKQEYAHYPNIYHRPSGKDYVSKLLYVSAEVERPHLHFEFYPDELFFAVDANQVLRAKEKVVRQRKKFQIRNRSQTTVAVTIRVEPGNVFSLKTVSTIKKDFLRYDAELDEVKVEPGTAMEITLEATVNFDLVLEEYKKLKARQVAEPQLAPQKSRSSRLIGQGKLTVGPSAASKASFEEEESQEKYDVDVSDESEGKKFTARPRDSLQMPVSKESSPVKKCDDDAFELPKQFRLDYGESAERYSVSTDLKNVPEDTPNEAVILEDVVFEQCNLMKQTITPELQIHFPKIEVRPDTLNFGHVYLGETSVRYVSVRNLTHYRTEIKVVWEGHGGDFNVRPEVLRLPAVSQTGDRGTTITVEFKPQTPGAFKKSYAVYPNKELIFEHRTFTVCGIGTWDERYRYPKVDDEPRSGVYSATTLE